MRSFFLVEEIHIHTEYVQLVYLRERKYDWEGSYFVLDNAITINIHTNYLYVDTLVYEDRSH